MRSARFADSSLHRFCAETDGRGMIRCGLACQGAVVLDESMVVLRDVWESTSFQLDLLQAPPHMRRSLNAGSAVGFVCHAGRRLGLAWQRCSHVAGQSGVHQGGVWRTSDAQRADVFCKLCAATDDRCAAALIKQEQGEPVTLGVHPSCATLWTAV
jgi:hypothetical protein